MCVFAQVGACIVLGVFCVFFECLYICVCVSSVYALLTHIGGLDMFVVGVYVPSWCPLFVCFCLFYPMCFQCFLVVTIAQYPSVLLGAATDSKVSFVL